MKAPSSCPGPISTQSTLKRPVLQLLPLVALLGLAGVTAGQAGNTWDGGDSTDNWTFNNNWSPDGSPTPGNTADLTFAGSTRLNSYNNYSGYQNWRNIILASGAGSFNITSATGSNWNLYGKIENLSSNAQSITIDAIAIQSGQPATGEFDPTNGNLSITAKDIYTNGNDIKVFGGANTLTINNGGGGGISQGGGFIINGSQTVLMTGSNSYNGDTQILNGGTLTLGPNGTINNSTVRMGTTGGASGAVNFNIGLVNSAGGQSIASTVNARAISTGSLSLNSQNISGTNTLSGHIALDRQLMITQSGGGTLNITQAKGLDNTTGTDIKGHTITFAPAATGTIAHSGTIYNSTGSGNVTLNGAGTLSLTGGNTYTGTTTISGGTLLLGASNVLPDGSAVSLGGGTLATAAGGAILDTAGTLSMSASSTISLPGVGNVLTFNSVGSLTGTLSVWNWTGVLGTINGLDRLLVTNGVANTDYANVNFFSDNAGLVPVGSGARLLSNGVNYELVPVPEPGALFAGLALLAPLAWRERRHWMRCAAARV